MQLRSIFFTAYFGHPDFDWLLISQQITLPNNTICLNLAASSLITTSLGFSKCSGANTQEMRVNFVNTEWSSVLTNSQFPNSTYKEIESTHSIILILPSGLGGQGRTPGQPGIHFNDTVFHGSRVKSKLNVTFAHNAQVANNIDRSASQHLELCVGECLGWGHDNRVTC